MSHKQLLSTKFALVALAAALVFFGQLKYRQWQSSRAIEREKIQLQQQADALTKKNQELSDSLSYLNSDTFKEKVAREQLNLKKDGEVVFNFTSGPTVDSAAGTDPGAGIGNPRKWWNYFFASK